MMKKTLKRVNTSNKDFIKLVHLLDASLKVTDQEDHHFYHQYNGINDIKHALVLYVNDKPAACGAFKYKYDQTVEIKRMFVTDQHRGKGLSKIVLAELESWAKEEGHNRCVLETGSRQVAALGLYPSFGYKIIDNYDQYAGVENSVCFEKRI